MSRRADVVTLVAAVVVHAALAVVLMRPRGGGPPARRAPVVLEYQPPPPAPPPAAARPEAPRPPAPAQARRKVALRPRAVPAPSRAAEAPAPAPSHQPPPPGAPPRPVFGVAMESTTAVESPVAVAAGGTTMADPGGPRAGAPGGRGASSSGSGSGAGAPVSELEVGTMPDIDADACGRSVTYPEDAERNGIEGDVRLRVALDASGRVRNAHVLSGLGHGLDQAAVEALRQRCKFKPAKDKQGTPVAFVIESYTFHFELPR